MDASAAATGESAPQSIALFPRFTLAQMESLTAERPSYMRWQRFAYQVMFDTYAYGLDIPIRLLLVDRLFLLPNRIVRLLNDTDVKKLLLETLPRSDAENQVAELAALSVSEVSERLNRLDEQLSSFWVGGESIAAPTEGDDLFYEVLRILRTHIESDVWLTELSNTPSLHVLWRLHDIWPIYLLLWCYRNRYVFKQKATLKSEAEITLSQEFDSYSLPAFDESPLGIAVLPQFSLMESGKEITHQKGLGAVVPLIGPFLRCRLDEPERANLTSRFLSFAKSSRALSRYWLRHRDTSPTREELMDGVHSLEFIPPIELAKRARILAAAIDVAFAVELFEIEPPDELDRVELERIFALLIWLAQFLTDLAYEENARLAFMRTVFESPTHLQFANSKYCLVASELDVSGPVEVFGCIDLRRARDLDEDTVRIALDKIHRVWELVGVPVLPSTLLHRIRATKDAAWTNHIVAMNNLLNRQLSSGLRERPVPPIERGTSLDLNQEDDKDELRHEDEAWILMGFGGALCQSLVSLTRADMVSVYWLNYSETPPRLRHVAGYSRHSTHRAYRNEIVSAFDDSTWKKDSIEKNDARQYCGKSLLYRVAYFNQAEHVSGDIGAVWNGYPEDFRPACAMAVPIRFGARVIGVLGCNGLAPGQLSPTLYAPLRKASQLLGPFMHSTLMLRSISSMVHLVDTTPPMEWRRVRTTAGNRVDHLARLLCNVFLSPVAQVWVSGSDSNQYRLLSSSVVEQSTEDLDEFTINALPQRKNERGFSELAVLDWKRSMGQEDLDVTFDRHRYPNESLAFGLNSGALGDFILGEYVPGLSRATNIPAPAAIVRGSVVYVYDDFVNARAHRRKMFVVHGLRRVMSFTLPHFDRTTLNGSPSGQSRPIGVVSLFDKHRTPMPSAGSVHGVGSYGLEWQPIVQYMQEIVPSILQQARLIETSIDRAHGIVIHEAAKALDQLVDQSTKLFQQLHFVLNGPGRDLLAQLAHVPPVGLDEKVLSALWATVRAAGPTLASLEAGNIHGNLRRIASRLKHVNAYSHLDLDPDEAIEEIDVGQDLVRRMKALFPTRGGAISTYLDIKGMYLIEVEPSLWERVISNALSNMAKYGEPDTYSIWFKGNTLMVQNYGQYDVDRDSPSWRHLQYGVRGSASPNKPGDGFGLYIARDAARLLGIDFEYKIIPALGNERRARYLVELNLTNVLSRGRA